MKTDSPNAVVLSKERLSLWIGITGIIIGLMGIGAAIVVSYFGEYIQKEPRGLTVVVLSRASLVQVAEQLSDLVTITYLDTPVRNVWNVEIQVQSSGRNEIRPEDFISPLQITFPEGTVVSTASVSRTEPPEVEPRITFSGNVATLQPTLLNAGRYDPLRFASLPGDTIWLSLLVLIPADIDDSLSPIFSARVAGMQRLDVRDATTEALNSDGSRSTAVMMLCGIQLVIGLLAIGIIRVITRQDT